MRAAAERDVQRACLEWLTLWGALAVRVNSGGVRVGRRYVRFNSEPGCADALGCLPGGQFLSLEFKRPGRDRTAPARKVEQAGHRERVERAGGLALVVGSVDELIRRLTDAGYDTTRRA